MQIKVYAVHPQTLKKLDVRLEVHKNKTLAEATELAWKVRSDWLMD
jgi:ubiquitin carboxyl-terminal hydrolase 47